MLVPGVVVRLFILSRIQRRIEVPPQGSWAGRRANTEPGLRGFMVFPWSWLFWFALLYQVGAQLGNPGGGQSSFVRALDPALPTVLCFTCTPPFPPTAARLGGGPGPGRAHPTPGGHLRRPGARCPATVVWAPPDRLPRDSGQAGPSRMHSWLRVCLFFVCFWRRNPVPQL